VALLAGLLISLLIRVVAGWQRWRRLKEARRCQ
jgi:hypothetical protein